MKSSTNLSRYAWLSICVAVVTFAMKLFAWWLTGSVGLLSDALESLVNVAAAVIALISLSVSARPADDDHAYGHTKVEYFASGMEGAMILVAACGIGWGAVEHLVHPHPLESVAAGLWIATIASVLNFAVARILFVVGRREHSVALEADAHHLMTDVWTSIAVITGVGLVVWTGLNWLDPLIGLLVAVHIIFIGIKLVRQAMMGLMDTALPAEEMDAIRVILGRHAAAGVQFHALRTRQAGAWRFMSVHLLVPGEWTISKGHDVAESIEAEIRRHVPRITVLTHLEPIEDPVSWEDTELERSQS